jgi:hypothetical protein
MNNPSYSGSRFETSLANSSRDPISKKPTTKKDLWSGSRCRPWVQDPAPQKKKKEEIMGCRHGTGIHTGYVCEEERDRLYLVLVFSSWAKLPFFFVYCRDILIYLRISEDIIKIMISLST